MVLVVLHDEHNYYTYYTLRSQSITFLENPVVRLYIEPKNVERALIWQREIVPILMAAKNKKSIIYIVYGSTIVCFVCSSMEEKWTFLQFLLHAKLLIFEVHKTCKVI